MMGGPGARDSISSACRPHGTIEHFEGGRVRSRPGVDLDAVYHCTETASITQGVSRAKSAFSPLRHYNRRTMALPYP